MVSHVFVSVVGMALAISSLDCSNRLPSSEASNIIRIEQGGEPLDKMMYFNREHERWYLVIKENTLNDTAMLGRVIKIPPKQTGKFWQAKCFRDSIPFNYKPYKATQGKLVVEYYSKPY